MNKGERLWVLEDGKWEPAKYEFRVENNEPLGQHSVHLENGHGRRVVCSCKTRTVDPYAGTDPKPADPMTDPSKPTDGQPASLRVTVLRRANRIDDCYEVRLPGGCVALVPDEALDWEREVAERTTGSKLYPVVDVVALGEHYTKHVLAMTVEGLDGKAEIATQLAWRDQQIESLRWVVDAARAMYPHARSSGMNDALAAFDALGLERA